MSKFIPKKGNVVSLNTDEVLRVRELVRLGKEHPFNALSTLSDMEEMFDKYKTATITGVSFKRDYDGYCNIIFENGKEYGISGKWLIKVK